MTLVQIVFSFLALCGILTAAAWLDWSSIAVSADDLAVCVAGVFAPVWDTVGASLARLLF
jgi:hypothetical protein